MQAEYKHLMTDPWHFLLTGASNDSEVSNVWGFVFKEFKVFSSSPSNGFCFIFCRSTLLSAKNPFFPFFFLWNYLWNPLTCQLLGGRFSTRFHSVPPCAHGGLCLLIVLSDTHNLLPPFSLVYSFTFISVPIIYDKRKKNLTCFNM